MPNLLPPSATVRLTLAIGQGPAGPRGLPGDGADLSQIAAAPLAQHAAVALNAAGQAVPADCTTALHAETTIGIARAAAGATAEVQVAQRDTLDDSTWAWTPGAPVFVGLAGALVQTVPANAVFARQVGVALTPTRLLVQLQPAIYL